MGRMPNDDDSPEGISAGLISPSADPAGPPGVNDYDSFAEAYSAENEVSLANAYYERPATLVLAGDVAGRRILDAGCGSGPLFAALRDRGAIVTGFDSSAGMLKLARRRLGDEADLQVADLGRPLPFPDGAFDDVIASLVLHYLEDWTAPLAELRRVLKPGGRLIASVMHPMFGHPMIRPGADYWATYQWDDENTFGVLRYWHRPLPAMIEAFTSGGFRISAISEPRPALDTPRELLPDFLQDKPPAPASCVSSSLSCRPTNRRSTCSPRVTRRWPAAAAFLASKQSPSLSCLWISLGFHLVFHRAVNKTLSQTEPSAPVAYAVLRPGISRVYCGYLTDWSKNDLPSAL
jgi:ubiquinone/menaquinone biosynthesis C-methylase UbiE